MSAIHDIERMAAQPRAFRLVRRAVEAPAGAIVHGYIDGLDDETLIEQQEAETGERGNWWEILSFDDLDSAVADIGAHAVQTQMLIDKLTTKLRRLRARQDALIIKHAELVPAPPDGGTRKLTKGTYSGGNYSNQPSRLPEIKLTDKEAARLAGFAREKIIIEADTKAIREADPAALVGVELIQQPAVSYTAPKVAAE